MHGQQTNPLHDVKARNTAMRRALLIAAATQHPTGKLGQHMHDAKRRGAGVRPLALKAGGK